MMATTKHSANRRQRFQPQLRANRFEHDHLRIAEVRGRRTRSELAVDFEGKKYILVVGAIVRSILDLQSQNPNDREPLTFAESILANGGSVAEDFLCGIRSHDQDVTGFNEIGFFKVSSRLDIEPAHMAVGILHSLGLY